MCWNRLRDGYLSFLRAISWIGLFADNKVTTHRKTLANSAKGRSGAQLESTMTDISWGLGIGPLFLTAFCLGYNSAPESLHGKDGRACQ